MLEVETRRSEPAVIRARFFGDPEAEADAIVRALSPPGLVQTPLNQPGKDGRADCELSWARSGAMLLTGHAGGVPLAPKSPIGARLRGALLALERLSPCTTPDLDLPTWLSARAHANGRTRNGRISVNGTCRLVRARDHWVAVNLPRESDTQSVPAIVGRAVGEDPWRALEDFAGANDARTLVENAQLLSVAAARLGEIRFTEPPVTIVPHGDSKMAASGGALIVDLSALWAGPLCARLLGQENATLIKIESERRPDGARLGNAAFYNWLNCRHHSVCLDFRDRADVRMLRALLERADIVIESSRPRAFDALGIYPEEFLTRSPGRLWISITGYGRSSSASNRVAFGDDAAVAGGLIAVDGEDEPVFCGDAIADPLTGVLAAIAARLSLRAGGGRLLEMSMSGVSAFFANPGERKLRDYVMARSPGGWCIQQADGAVDVAPPSAVPSAAAARALGADTRQYAQAASKT